MKKLTFMAMAMAVIALVACGNKTAGGNGLANPIQRT